MPTTPTIDVDGQPVHDVQLQALSEADDGNGVGGQSDLTLSNGTADMDVDVASGIGYYDGTETSLGSSTTKTLSTGDATDDRWDTIAFDVSTGSVVVHEGTPAAAPGPPGLNADEILLGVVYVAAETTALDAADIVDWRLVGGPPDIDHDDVQNVGEDQHHSKDHDHTESDIATVPADGLTPASLGGLGLPTHHIEYAGGLADEELARVQLEAGEQLAVYALGLELKGGGSDTNLTLDLYDADAGSVLASTTAGSLATGSPIGTSGSGATILIRLSTGSSGPHTLCGSGKINIT